MIAEARRPSAFSGGFSFFVFMEIRNIAIIAHVDHGKTTLTDAIMRQTGASKEGASMDSNALEQERGITIYAKNSAVFYKGTKINILDTPGHTDFGSEVERVLRSIDSVLLVVDAQEGPMPQTRFVLKKSLELGLRPIVVINKIDKPAADPARAAEQVYELFLDLGADDEQLDFPVVYAAGRDGVAKAGLEDDSKDLMPLLDAILQNVPPTSSEQSEGLLLAQPFNLAYDNFLGRMGVARIYQGKMKAGETVYVRGEESETYAGKITKLFTFEGTGRKEADEAVAGDIVLIAGLPDIDIGETICQRPDQEPLSRIAVDSPTISLAFLVNNSPFAGREGEFVTSRQIKERLEKEAEVNVGLRVDVSSPDEMKVQGRGELHIAILLETMRREGYELQVSQPQVIMKEIDGVSQEPFEEIVIDVPPAFQGAVMEKMGRRGAVMTGMRQEQDTIRMMFEGPTRGLFGYRGEFVVDTKGEGVYASRFVGFRPCVQSIARRRFGSMISMATGKALGYSLANLQERGTLYIGPGEEVYEGMVIGKTSRGEDMTVNPIKGKHLTNMRASGSDDALHLDPPIPVTIERGLEIMAEDEYLEITPQSVRLRKRYLTEVDRARAQRGPKK